jgi:hypothetical protein
MLAVTTSLNHPAILFAGCTEFISPARVESGLRRLPFRPGSPGEARKWMWTWTWTWGGCGSSLSGRLPGNSCTPPSTARADRLFRTVVSASLLISAVGRGTKDEGRVRAHGLEGIERGRFNVRSVRYGLT